MENLEHIETALAHAERQDESLATYAPRLHKSEAEVDWNKSLAQLRREVRAFNPWPVSYTSLDGHSLRLWSARADTAIAAGDTGEVVRHDGDGVYVSCADGVLQVTELQFAGRNRCSAAQALNSRDLTGSRLGRS